MRGFISYRRGDSQAEANGLLDGLRHRLPEWKLYMDVDSIPGGVDFEEHIRQEIESCDVVLVVIGPDWLDVRPEKDIRRIEADGDYVRLEIECALTAPSATVIPVLVGGAEMPIGAELPDSIRGLARRNAVGLDRRRWSADLEGLSRQLGELKHKQTSPPKVSTLSAQGSDSPVRSARHSSSIVGWLVAVSPIVTFGFAAFLPPIWAAVRRPGERAFRTKMFLVAAAFEIAVIVGWISLFTGSTDASGQVTDAGALTAIWVAVLVAFISAALGIVYRNPPSR